MFSMCRFVVCVCVCVVYWSVFPAEKLMCRVKVDDAGSFKPPALCHCSNTVWTASFYIFYHIRLTVGEVFCNLTALELVKCFDCKNNHKDNLVFIAVSQHHDNRQTNVNKREGAC